MTNETEARYFSGETELKGCYPLRNEVVRAKYPNGKIKRSDSFDLLVGTVDGKYNTVNFLPVTRVILYKVRGSKHVCDHRCRGAKGGNCECSCGGKYHGVDA